MTASQPTMEALRGLGLTDYQARAYTTLTYRGRSTATEISKEAGIPRTRIYKVLGELEEKEWISVERGRPLHYRAGHPAETFRAAKEKLLGSLEPAESELMTMYDAGEHLGSASMWVLHGQQAIEERVREMLQRTREEVTIFGGLYFPGEPRRLLPLLQELKNRGVQVRVITRDSVTVDGQVVDIAGPFSALGSSLQAAPVPLPVVKFAVVDSRELVLTLVSFEGEDAISSTAMGIWNTYPEMTNMVGSMFSMMWKSRAFHGIIRYLKANDKTL